MHQVTIKPKLKERHLRRYKSDLIHYVNYLSKYELPWFGQRQVIFYKALFQAVLRIILFEIQNGHLK